MASDMLLKPWHRFMGWQARRECREAVEACARCEAMYGKGDDECLDVILAEKRCLAERLCDAEAERYYTLQCFDIRKQTKNKYRINECRAASYALSSCLYKHLS